MLSKKLTHVNMMYERSNYLSDDIKKIYEKSKKIPDFFVDLARDLLFWEKDFKKVFDDSNAPLYKWFADGMINPFYNILSKHLDSATKNKAALIWKGSDHTERIYTYQSLYSETMKFASALKKLGVSKGDKVFIYMPNIPELVISMLACVRIGAVHVVYHHSYSSEAFAERIDDCAPDFIICCDISQTGSEREIKNKVDISIGKASYSPKHCIVVQRSEKRVHMKPLRDLWYHDLISDEDFSSAKSIENVYYESNDPLFMMYTSTNLKVPKSLVYNCAGYLLWTYFSYLLIFDPTNLDTYWSTADISWISGHTYGVYGPLMAGQTVLVFEDTLDINNAQRFYDICEKFQVTKFYTTPTILKSIMNAAQKRSIYRKLKSIKLVATGGEKAPEDLVEWVFKKILFSNKPIINVYSLTEAGGALAANIPGFSEVDFSNVSKPLPGIQPVLYDEFSDDVIEDTEKKGLLMLSRYTPSLCSKIFNGNDLYKNIYWKKVGGEYLFKTGDGAEFTEDGSIILTGRMDDVMHIGGKRLSFREIEAAIKKHPLVLDAAVININDEKRGDMLVAFCVLKKKLEESYYDLTVREIRETIISEIGEIVLPDEIKFTRALPKSPDGEILRDMLKEIAIQM